MQHGNDAAVLLAGHLCLDLIPALPGPPSLVPGDLWTTGPLTLQPGGCLANTGTALLDLGVTVALRADVGDDGAADTLRSLMQARGFDVSGLRHTRGSTSYSVVVQPPGQDRTFWHHVGANASFDGSAVRFAAQRMLHIGYPTLLPALVGDDGGPLLDLLRRGRTHGLATSVDLAVVPGPTDSTRRLWRTVLPRVLPEIDVITPSFDDLATALGEIEGTSPTPESLRQEARKLVDRGAAIALVSGGSAGFGLAAGDAARFAGAGPVIAGLPAEWHGTVFSAPAAAVAGHAATTGAGDCATAGFLAALLRGDPPTAAVAGAAASALARISGAAPGAG